MIIGNPASFAIESEITQAYKDPGKLGLGFFIVHIGGRQYGVRAPDATLLALAFDSSNDHLARRGTRVAPFSSYKNGKELFDALAAACYSEDDRFVFQGHSLDELSELLLRNKLRWHDPDEAFDDGTAIYHFDVGDRVRLLATNGGDPTSWRHNSETFSDVWLPADEFYGVIKTWQDCFVNEWERADKTAGTP
jgi:hypothetical protein